MLTPPIARAHTIHGCDDRYSAANNQQHEITSQTVPSIGLDQLIARLKATSAIGFFTKLALRSDVITLQSNITAATRPLENLRRQFDGLVLKILALLDNDPDLARDIYQARESIWQSLIQPSHSVTAHNRPRITS